MVSQFEAFIGSIPLQILQPSVDLTNRACQLLVSSSVLRLSMFHARICQASASFDKMKVIFDDAPKACRDSLKSKQANVT